MTEPQHERTVGATAGLPGDNAAPQTSQISDDERDETVSTAGVAPPDEDDGAR